MGKGYVDLTPEQCTDAAERTRSLKLFGEKHGLKNAQERMRGIGEKPGLNQLRKAEVAPPPEPREATPQQRKRKQGGGNKPLLSGKQITDGKATYRSMLVKNATWADNKTASAKRVIELLKLGDSVSVWTVKRWIVGPILKEREQNKRRP